MDVDSVDKEGNPLDSIASGESADKTAPERSANDEKSPQRLTASQPVDEEESMEASSKVVKRRRLIVEEDSDEEDPADDPEKDDNDESEETDHQKDTSKKRKNRIIDDDSEEEDGPADDPEKDKSEETDHHKDTSIKRKNRIIDDDSEEEDATLNSSKKVIRNLKSICDEESSDEEQEQRNEAEDEEGEDDDDRNRKSPMDSSEEDSNANDGPSPSRSPKAKKPQRKAKAAAEHVISMIQKNAREEELAVPYHCPEQQNLKDFLERLQSRKSALVVEEKVEMKTHKFKLLKDIPKEEIPVKEPSIDVVAPAADLVDLVNEIPKLQPFTEKLTLKGSSDLMIDLETGQTFTKKTVADKLISDLMRNNRRGLQSNDPKFQPEPVPGAPMKQLKKNLECELERKRKETILKILEVEKEAKDEEEELLDDEEFELDSDDEGKKKRSKKKEALAGEDEDQDLDIEKEKKTVEFNDEEMEEVEEGGGNPEDLENDEEDNEEVEDDENEEEEDVESSSESEPEEEPSEVKKPLRRIVAMEDSDEEQETPQPPTVPPSQVSEIAAPLFDDIPTEPLFEFGFNATQNDNELFDLCSGKFTTQLPTTDSSSQVLVEASQVKDFEFPATCPLQAATQNEERRNEPEEKTGEDLNLDVAGPQKFNLSSSEDEQSVEKDDQQRVKKKTKTKKKRIFIEADDEDEDSLPAKPEDSEEEDEFPSDEEDDQREEATDNQLPPEAIEELEEYKSFLSGKPATAAAKPERLNVADFLEKEAELSDSEWGSEDEDERGLDQLEDVEGLVKDDDEFDESVMRDELGRIHMRQMANEDNRELKYLKDLILNEEEMDGQGRQRTFRWQSANNENDDFNATTGNNGGVDGDLEGNQSSDDDENEANWRKVRLEREQALLTANKSNVTTIQSRLEAVMRQTRDIRVVKPASSAETVLKENSSPSFLMQEQSKKYMNLRQSFLLRDDETLNRLATISAKADGASGAVSDGKNNFVFRRIEEKPSANVDSDPPKKRKSNGPNGLQSINPAQKKRKV